MCWSGVGVYSAEAGAESESKISDSVHLWTPHIAFVRITSSMVNLVEVFVSMPAVRAFSGSTLIICFGLAGRDYTFDGSRGVTRGAREAQFPGLRITMGARNDCRGR